MKQMKLIAGTAILALSSLLAFGQTALAAGSAAPPVAAPAASAVPSDPTTANANVDCKLQDGSKKTVTAKAAGKNAVAIAKCGEDPKPVVRRPAAPPTNTATNAETVKRLAEELAGLRAKAEECVSGSWRIFQRSDGSVQRVCKGANDEVFPAPAVAAPVVNPAIVHGRTAVSSAPASAGTSAAGGTSEGATGKTIVTERCNFSVDGKLVDFKMISTDRIGGAREECLAWQKAKIQAQDAQVQSKK